MKRLTIFGVLFTAAALFGSAERAAVAHSAPYPSHQRLTVDIDSFYDALTPYGLWVSEDPYGTCWAPDVSDDWSPYGADDGYWVRSDYGWTWVSNEPWGWATFHYGRWAWTDDYGWVWIPGTEWAPAWVAWRYGGGLVGWAPLPPEARWDVRVGFSIGEFEGLIRPRAWCFVHDRDFLRPHVGRYRLRDREGSTWVRTTKDATRYVEANGRIINEGVDVRTIEKRTGRPIPVLRVTDRPDQHRAVVHGRDIGIYRPEVRSAGNPGERDFRPPEMVARQVNENRRALERQREERARFEARYQARIMSLPPSERQGIARRMTDDQRRLYETQRIARREIMRQNARGIGNPRGPDQRGTRDSRGPNQRGADGGVHR